MKWASLALIAPGGLTTVWKPLLLSLTLLGNL